MFSKDSLKRIICFALAVLMLLATAGCKKDDSGKKKKVIIKKKVIVTSKDDTDTNSGTTGDNTIDDSTSSREKRRLYNATIDDDAFKYIDDDFPDEFTSQNVDWDGPVGYVIVYSTNTPLNLASAQNLQKFFKDNDGVELPIYKDTEHPASAKEILVGDTNRYATSLSEKQFAVKLDGSKLIFEGGHKMMVEKAADWFMSVARVAGKVAVLEGKAEDFTSTVTVNGKTYEYAWGDEFDGVGGIDRTRWEESGQKNFYGDIAKVFNDLHFNRVEDGRLKMFADRYYDEENAANEYATGGVLSSHNTFCFRRGYAEWRAKVAYTRGSFPAWWTRSRVGNMIPSEMLNKRAYDFEIDIFECFASENRFYNTIHKWYAWYSSGSIYQDKAKTIDVTDKIQGWRPESGTAISTWSQSDESGVFKSTRFYEFKNYGNLSNEYHVYNFLWEDDHLWYGVDGEWYADFDIDIAFDGYDGNNNGGYGFDLFHAFLIDAHIFSPMSAVSSTATADQVLRNKDLPIPLYTDYLRLYQDPTDTGVDQDGRILSSIISKYENTTGK